MIVKGPHTVYAMVPRRVYHIPFAIPKLGDKIRFMIKQKSWGYCDVIEFKTKQICISKKNKGSYSVEENMMIIKNAYNDLKTFE